MSAPVVIPVDCTAIVAPIAEVLATFLTGGHQLSLCLAGALLHRGVAAEAVPEIIAAATARAGWSAPAPDHYRRNGLDTVHRWTDGRPIRFDVPPALSLVLDRVTRPVEQTMPLEQATAELERAIADAPDGVSTIGTGCGVGKTRAAELVAARRAAEGLRTVISVPTNELALQVTADLRAAGVAVCRVFGPTSLEGPGACRYRAAARVLASGHQSVSAAVCEGYGAPCPHLETCEAARGADGHSEARVVIGNHAMLTHLGGLMTGQALGVIDEPPAAMVEAVFSTGDLALTGATLRQFVDADARALAPGLAALRWLLAHGELDVPVKLDELDVDVDEQLEAAGALTTADAANAMPPQFRAPRIRRGRLVMLRAGQEPADDTARASRVLAAVRWALIDRSVRCTVFEPYNAPGERRVAVVGIDPQLGAALRQAERVVIMGADVGLHAPAYATELGYTAPHTALAVRDGCRVRRVHVLCTTSSRRRWIHEGRPPTRALHHAHAVAREAGDRVAIVTHKRLVPWVRRELPGADVAHFGALRGLDRWKDFDALITLGDPLQPIDSVARTIGPDDDLSERVNDLARAELEQAHGRLRVVHRERPCTMVHVGRLVPLGWHEPIETHDQGMGGAPKRSVAVEGVRAAVDAAGGVSAAARLVGVARCTVHRWTRGTTSPTAAQLAALGVAETGEELISNPFLQQVHNPFLQQVPSATEGAAT